MLIFKLKVNVTCEDQPDSDVVSTECKNGQWQPEVNCNAVVKSSLPSMSTEGSLTTISPGIHLFLVNLHRYTWRLTLTFYTQVCGAV
jgi:hypothetical protein